MPPIAPIDRDILLDAISALTGANVKHHHEMKPHQKHQLLQFEHFVHATASKHFYVVDDMSMVENEFFVDIENFFDPSYDYDFRDMKDFSKCIRGGKEYTRPFGWYRFALKVLDKYENNVWLGTAGWRSGSAPGEWPVSFHGTSIKGAHDISEGYYKPGHRKAFGPGVYSTPCIKVAEMYSKKFTSKKTGQKYEVIMQNRIAPDQYKIIPEEENKVGEYWLIEIPTGTPTEEVKKIVNSKIRPYGILIKEA